jgi:hypothetical protein
MLASQTQAGDTQSWQLDPNGERLATQTDSVTGVTTNHYADDSDNPSLMTNSNGTWMRNVTGPLALEHDRRSVRLPQVDFAERG